MSHTVIFTGGSAPEKSVFERYCRHHGRADFVVAADSGLETALLFEAEPDVIVGDMDSISDKSVLKNRAGKIEVFPCDKDFSDTELALSCAIKHESSSWITLVGGGGGRIDHFLSIFDIFSSPSKNFPSDFRPMDVWLPGGDGVFQSLYFLPDGKTLFVSDISESDYISVCRTSRDFSSGRVETRGLQWSGDVFRREGMPSLSNRISSESKTAELSAHGADFVVIVPREASCRRR